VLPYSTLRPALVAGLFILSLAACGRGPAPEQYLEFTGDTMGTSWTVRISSPEALALDADGREELAAAIQAEVDLVNEKMSTWREDSELSRFNAHDSSEPFAVSPETLHVFAAARLVSEESRGAFDITVGPLVNAWGFGPQAVTAPPGDDAIAALLEKVGYEKVLVDEEAGTVRKVYDRIYCDLSAIAKGYGTDRIADMLDERGYDYMAEVGGEIRANGVNHRGEVWRIGIINPDENGQPTSGVVPLRDTAMATSGDYRNIRLDASGRPYSHTIDPRTGRPVDHGLASATIIHPSAMMADAYATVLMVLGPDEGYDWALEMDLPVHLITHDGDGFTSRSTPAFEALYR